MRSAPLRAPDLTGLPATTIIAAGRGPSFIEGFAYAERLKSVSVPTEYILYEGGVHGFWYATARLQIARDELDKGARALQIAFGSRDTEA